MNMLPVYINGASENGRQTADTELSTECKSPAKRVFNKAEPQSKTCKVGFMTLKEDQVEPVYLTSVLSA